MKRIALFMLFFYTVSLATAQTSKEYKVDKTKSSIKWEAKKVVGGHEGTIALKEGFLKLNADDIVGGHFVVDMASLVCTDVERVTGHLKNADFFDVEKFPASTFVINKVEQKESGTVVTGKLTIKGITKEISFPVTVSVDGSGLVAKANVTVNRLDYDIKYRSSSFFADLGNRAIEDEFTLRIALVATAQ